jgi:site-specific recombinase XerD
MKDIKDMIGHSEIKMTDRYTHLTDARKVALQEKLAHHYNGTSSAESMNPLPESVKHWWEGTQGNT